MLRPFPQFYLDAGMLWSNLFDYISINLIVLQIPLIGYPMAATNLQLKVIYTHVMCYIRNDCYNVHYFMYCFIYIMYNVYKQLACVKNFNENILRHMTHNEYTSKTRLKRDIIFLLIFFLFLCFSFFQKLFDRLISNYVYYKAKRECVGSFDVLYNRLEVCSMWYVDNCR